MNTPLQSPVRSSGLAGVLSHRYLLRLLVDKEIQVRYRGSVLGLLWSYIKPAVQFGVFYVAMGVFLGLGERTENYAIYLFSGVALMNLFTEAFGNAARSVVGNGYLVRKIYLPRELFPVSSLWVAVVHFLPQVLILLIACIAVGWHPTWLALGSIFLGFAIVWFFALGIGLLFATADVFFRDAENLVDLINMVATWLSPVLYVWTMVHDVLPNWLFHVYMLNPLTVAVELYHYAFWMPTVSDPASWEVPPHLFSIWTPAAVTFVAVLVVIGNQVFKHFEGHFAQEL